MQHTSEQIPAHFKKAVCHGDSALLERTGRFRAAIVASPPQLLNPNGGFLDIPTLIINADKGCDPTLVESLLCHCVMRTLHVSAGDGYTLLGIAICSPELTLAVIVDPFTPMGRHFIERWQACGELVLALFQQEGTMQFIEAPGAAGVSELLALTSPDHYDARLNIPLSSLAGIYEALRSDPGLKQLVVIAASDRSLAP